MIKIGRGVEGIVLDERQLIDTTVLANKLFELDQDIEDDCKETELKTEQNEDEEVFNSKISLEEILNEATTIGYKFECEETEKPCNEYAFESLSEEELKALLGKREEEEGAIEVLLEPQMEKVQESMEDSVMNIKLLNAEKDRNLLESKEAEYQLLIQRIKEKGIIAESVSMYQTEDNEIEQDDEIEEKNESQHNNEIESDNENEQKNEIEENDIKQENEFKEENKAEKRHQPESDSNIERVLNQPEIQNKEREEIVRSEKEKMLVGEMYIAWGEEIVNDRRRARKLLEAFNNTDAEDKYATHSILASLFGKVGEYIHIEPSFKCSYGYNIEIGNNFYMGYNCVILDQAPVKIGDNCIISPQVGIYTLAYPLNTEQRVTGYEYAKPVTIGNNVWIGGGTIINPGVSIGDNVVVFPGAVIVSDVPNDALVAGNPAKIIRNIIA